ncbi:MAG: transglutaminase domain-containing protein [Reyranellaceae bacterium]
MTLDVWSHPVGMTDPGAAAALLDGLPADAAALAAVVQGLLIHQHIAPAYGVALTAAQQDEPHLRPVAALLEHLTATDPRPLHAARPPEQRLAAVCRHFTVLHVALLRRHGLAARARCGFAAYFEPGQFVDHWVSEYWHEAAARWVLADAQLDARQCEIFGIDFDPLDVPRDRFLVAGEAWRRCRAGEADPQAFGILDLRGPWFVAGNVVRDVAALNNREMLPWDVWGAMPRADEAIDEKLFDRLAEISRAPDRSPDALQEACRDPRVAVPDRVFNALRNRPEAVNG